MSEVSDRYRRVAECFTARVDAVPEADWDRPSPCDGWVARDIVGHVVGTGQRFVARVGLELPQGPPYKKIPSVPGQRRATAS